MKISIFSKFKKAVALPLIFVGVTAFAQDAPKKEAPKVTFKPVGSIAASYTPGKANSAFFNFGGPGLRLEYGKFSIAYHMFPSLRYFMGDVTDAKDPYRTKAKCTPILGTGLQIGYKKVAVVMPFYYLPGNNVWIMSVGLGYKL